MGGMEKRLLVDVPSAERELWIYCATAGSIARHILQMYPRISREVVEWSRAQPALRCVPACPGRFKGVGPSRPVLPGAMPGDRLCATLRTLAGVSDAFHN